MKKQLLLLSLLFICIASAGFSQSLNLSVISSYGNFGSGATGNLSSTLGEPMVATFTASSNILTQGFEQPDDAGMTAVPDNSSDQFISVYPNPATDRLSIDGITASGPVELKLTDISGRVMIQKQVTGNQSKGEPEQLEIKDIKSGVYFLTITEKNSGKIIRTLRIIKI
ncbi:MAG: hypothetical protein JWP12_27 [Bacteroidetes bacterium]|nr:hypothetical protein [Bacteroidota bacterium]